jgi:hypothetical protein
LLQRRASRTPASARPPRASPLHLLLTIGHQARQDERAPTTSRKREEPLGPQDATEDFDGRAWHDNALYALRLDVGDVARGDWRSDLVLDIDHIVEWLCGAGRQVRFRVAPATLTFHHVTDLRIRVDCGDSGGRIALQTLSIDSITRERIRDQKICFDRPYWRWRIELNWPQGGNISLGASGFTQTLRAEPVLLDQQQLSPADRVPVGSGP